MIGLGKMQMSASEFWDMSLPELHLAMQGWADFHAGGKSPPLAKNELEELMELYPD